MERNGPVWLYFYCNLRLKGKTMENHRNRGGILRVLFACVLCISASPASVDGAEAAFSWGFNGNGQIGDNTTSQRTSPVPFGGLQDVIGVATGFIHNLAVKSDGTVWACGSNINGRLGDGTTMERHIPVPVLVPAASAVSAGEAFSLALTADQNVWAWGNDSSGQVG